MARSIIDDDSDQEIEKVPDLEVEETKEIDRANDHPRDIRDASAAPSNGRKSGKGQSLAKSPAGMSPRALVDILFPEDEEDEHPPRDREEKAKRQATESDGEIIEVISEGEEGEEEQEEGEDAISMVSVGDLVGSISATPSPPRNMYKGKGRMPVDRREIYVEIPLIPLEELDEYALFPSDIDEPTETSRSLLPTITDSEGEESTLGSSRSASIVPIRPKRAAQNTLPTWKVVQSPEFSEDELRLGTDGADGDSDGAYGEDELTEDSDSTSEEEDSEEVDDLVRRRRSKRRNHQSSRVS